MAKTTSDMGFHRLCFKTRPDVNGNTLTLVIDVDNKLFARNRFWANDDFLTLGKQDFRKLITRLWTANFEEVE